MKKHTILTAGFVIATMAVIVASQSVSERGTREQVKVSEVKALKSNRLYSADDIEFLMGANHWSRRNAVQVLELASKAAESKTTPGVGDM